MDKGLVQQILASLPIFINFTLVNCNSSWLPNMVYFMTQPNHEPSATVAQCGLLETFYQIGRFSFAIPSGIFADKCGRKIIITAIGFIQLLTWCAISVSRSLNVILIARLFQGCAAALSNTTGGNTVGEICSAKYRGIFLVVFKSFGTLGNIIECLLASVLHSYAETAYSTLGLSLLFLLAMPWIIESPYYLVVSSKYEQSERILAKLRAGQPKDEIAQECESLRRVADREKNIKSQLNWLQYLKLKSTRRPLICCVLLNALVLANGTNVISLYATVIFPPNKYFSNSWYPLILNLIQLGTSVGTAFLIDAFPRRHLFMLAGFLSFLMQAVNGIAYHEYSTVDDETQRNLWKWTFLVGTVIFWIISNVMIVPLNLVLKTEILPMSIRGFGNSICLICQSISTILCYQAFNFVEYYVGTAANYAIFATNSLLIIWVVYVFVPETRGKTLAEVQQSNREDEISNNVVKDETYTKKPYENK